MGTGSEIFGDALGGAESGAGMIGSIFGGSDRRASLRLRMRQIQDATRAQSIDQMTKLNHTLASQAAIRAAGGGGTAGTVSSNMISIADMNAFANDENADKLNEVFQKESVQSQIDASKVQEATGIFGSVVKGAKTASSFYTGAKAPLPQNNQTQDQFNNAAQSQPSAIDQIYDDQRKIEGLGLPRFKNSGDF